MKDRQTKRIRKYEWAIQELEQYHQHTLYKEIWNRNKENLNAVALRYQGREITYGEMFCAIDQFADALSAMDVRQGDEVPVCITNSPEFVYTLLALSKLGAIINSFGNWFAQDYLIYILNATNCKTVLLSSDNYSSIGEAVKAAAPNNVVVFTLDDSLPECAGEKYNPYFEEQKKYLPPASTLEEIRQGLTTKHVFDKAQFIKKGKGLHKAGAEKISLCKPFAITYTSGTTDPGRPKAVVHSIESYMLLSRFKDADVSGMGKMRNLRVLAHFPTYIHAGLTTAIIDPLFEACTVELSPIYSVDYFPQQVIRLKPNFVCASIAAWTSLARCLESNYEKIELPDLMLACVTGEGMSAGEERYLNQIAAKYRFGCGKLPWPLAPVTFSIGGGTSESSGVFVTLFKEQQRLLPEYWFGRKPVGLTPLNFAAVDVVHEDYTPCRVGELGTIAIASKCNMLGYHYTVKDGGQISYTTADGRNWMKMGAVGVKLDDFCHIQIKGRPTDYMVTAGTSKIWFYQIEENLYEEIEDLMSCTILKEQQSGGIIVHVQRSPLSKITDAELGEKCTAVLQKLFSPHEGIAVYLRIRSVEEGFPAAVSGKRDFGSLQKEGTCKAKRIL